MVSIDQKRFEQVIINLLNNAYFHSQSNSIISITVKSNQSSIQIVIQDQGEGIPPEDLSHIFERFYRVDKSRTRATGGSGLGLAIVKEIVEFHGGTIAATSQVGKGSVFTITLREQ